MIGQSTTDGSVLVLTQQTVWDICRYTSISSTWRVWVKSKRCRYGARIEWWGIKTWRLPTWRRRGEMG